MIASVGSSERNLFLSDAAASFSACSWRKQKVCWLAKNEAIIADTVLTVVLRYAERKEVGRYNFKRQSKNLGMLTIKLFVLEILYTGLKNGP